MREIGIDTAWFVYFMSVVFYVNHISNWDSNTYVPTVAHKVYVQIQSGYDMCLYRILFLQAQEPSCGLAPEKSKCNF